MDALDQLARMQKLNIHFTDIRPGFVATPLLNDQRRYPMLMEAHAVAKDILRAIERKKRVAIIDWKYRLLVGFWRLIPRWIWLRLPVRN
jgi:short-subunit dehydrogenase